MADLLTLRGLVVELPTPAGWVRPVNEVSLRIAEGEAVGLVGESGSGKTMMALAMMGLLPMGARVSGEAQIETSERAKRDEPDAFDRVGVARCSRARHRDGVSGADDGAESGDACGCADRGSGSSARAETREGRSAAADA